jgi:hypothetical protein
MDEKPKRTMPEDEPPVVREMPAPTVAGMEGAPPVERQMPAQAETVSREMPTIPPMPPIEQRELPEPPQMPMAEQAASTVTEEVAVGQPLPTNAFVPPQFNLSVPREMPELPTFPMAEQARELPEPPQMPMADVGTPQLPQMSGSFSHQPQEQPSQQRRLPELPTLPSTGSGAARERPSLPSIPEGADAKAREIPGAPQASMPPAEAPAAHHGTESKLVEVMGDLVKALKAFKDNMGQKPQESGVGPQSDGSFVPSLTPKAAERSPLGGRGGLSESILRDMRQRSQADRAIAMMRGA